MGCWQGWGVALFMLASQFWMLHIFVKASEIEMSDDNSDLTYTFKCPRDLDECRDTDDRDWRGWIPFGILLTVHLLKDVINGLKMVVLSGKERHSRQKRSGFFFGGLLLILISLYTVYTSVIYNKAI